VRNLVETKAQKDGLKQRSPPLLQSDSMPSFFLFFGGQREGFLKPRVQFTTAQSLIYKCFVA